VVVRRSLRSIYAIIMLNGVKPIIRSPLWLLVMLMYPLILVFFIYIFAEQAVPEALIGGAISIMTMTGLSLQADIVWYRVELKFQDMAVASPISPTTYMIGMMISELTYSSPALALFLTLMAVRGMLPALSSPMFISSLLLCWISTAALGFYLSTHIADMRHVWALESLLSMVLSMLPPIYYPITLLPGWAQTLSMVVPTTHAALLAKDAAGLAGLSSPQKIASLLILTAWTALFMTIAAKRSRWRED